MNIREVPLYLTKASSAGWDGMGVRLCKVIRW
jgi:hypothetical protein